MVLLTACGVAVPTGSTTPADPDIVDSKLEQVLTLVNEARAAGAICGEESYPPASALSYDAALSVPAQKHSEDMAAAGEMSHDTPVGAIHYTPGLSPWGRMSEEGFEFSRAGENIAYGYSSAATVMNGWLNSEGHCKNIMNPTFTVIGLGWQDSYWTQKFARPR